MAAILHQLDQQRLIDSDGIADASTVTFYLTGTTTPATIYSDAGLTTPLTNPITVAAGAALPDVYLDSEVTYRRLITYSDGSTDDTDPYTSPLGASTGSGLIGFLQSGTGAVARTAQAKMREAFSVTDFGAAGDGATDDTAAIALANTAAAAAGKALVFPEGLTFIASSLTPTTSWIGRGTIQRKAASTGDFITIGAANVLLDLTIDMNSVGNSTDRIVYNTYDGFETAQTFVAKNGVHNGVDSWNASDVKIRGTVIDCVQTHVFVYTSTTAITGLLVDVDVDGVTLGTSNLNGGVKIHATGGFAIKAPTIKARVRLAESASMPANAVCIELIGFNAFTTGGPYTTTVIENARVEGTAVGGSIGCTLAGCDDSSAVVVATGNNNLGLEVTSGCNRSGFAHGSSASAGPGGVGHKNGATITGSCTDCYVHADVSGVTNAVDAQAACFYVNGATRATLSGTGNQAAGNHYLRNIDSPQLTVQNMRLTGSVTRMITFANSLADCDGARFINVDVAGIGNVVQGASNHDGAYFYNCRIDNSSGLLWAGSPSSLTNNKFINCEFTTQPFGAGAKHIDVHNYVPGGAGLITLTRTGTPEGFITAAVGSTCRRDDGGASTSFYVKESGTGPTGWVGK